MKCPECGTVLLDEAKTCPNCGKGVDGVKNETKSGKASQGEVHKPSNGPAAEPPQGDNSLADRMKATIRKIWNKLDLFCKIETIAIAVVAIMCVVSFCIGKVFPIIFSVLQLVGLIVALLLHKEIIKYGKKWFKYLILVLAIAVTVLNVTSYSWFGKGNSNKTVHTPHSAADCVGMEYSALRHYFSTAGFENITFEIVEDLDITDKARCGKVDRISVDGEDDFKQNEKYSNNSRVVIRYHKYKRVAVPLSSEQIKTMDAEAVIKAFEDANFVDLSTDELYDLDPDTAQTEFETAVSIGGTSSFNKGEEFPPDATVQIITRRPYEKYSLKIIVDFTENLIFSTYDVELKVESHTEKMKHGKDAEFEYRLKQGKYTVTFKSTEDDSVCGTVEVDLNSDTEVSYKISCHSDEVDVETLYVDNKTQLGENEAKVPCSASNCKYENYKDVETLFKNAGFTNISTNILYDIVLGWTEEGEVEKVSVNGATKFKKGDVFAKDAPVVITYHMKEEDDPNKNNGLGVDSSNPDNTTNTKTVVTIDNNVEFAKLMKITNQKDVATIKTYANTHKGDIIEFDGCVYLMMKHGNYKTRFDVGVAGGNYKEERLYGPLFAFEDVNFYDMNVSGTDTIAEGMDFRVTAEIVGFSDAGGYIILEPVSLNAR